MHRNPLDLILSSNLILTSGILGVIHKCLWATMHKIQCEESVYKSVQSCPSFLDAGGGGGGRMRVIEILFGDF